MKFPTIIHAYKGQPIRLRILDNESNECVEVELNVAQAAHIAADLVRAVAIETSPTYPLNRNGPGVGSGQPEPP